MAINAINLKWFYSGGGSNSDPTLSCGGAKSSVGLVVSPSLHNLFDRVTGDEAAAGVTRFRCLYFQNTDTDSDGLMAPVVLYFSALPSNGDTIQMGLAVEGKGVSPVENLLTIKNENTAPDMVSFSQPLSKAAGRVLPSPPYAEGHYIGVWFKHIVPPNQVTSVGNTVSWVVVGDTV